MPPSQESDLRIPPGNRFEYLQGNLAGYCSIRVNKQYRLIFRWEAGIAHQTYLDPHAYKG
ncbi:type II toxin-antitoxin system RelE/ParE family toxin [Cobetia amphilecti]|uniref:type II toxin-antitoxin system RelE/ParE family toxin n=1 Tax=Cobetia amphilecti TaxID=1055104 RepID=UPI0014054611